MTTQEIADGLGDVPKSSVYRHLKLLLQGDLVEIVDTRLVNGIQEKRFRIAQTPILGPGDIALWTADDHISYFTTYTLTLMHDYAQYVARSEAVQGAIDMVADRAGYREVALYATPLELDVALKEMGAAIMPLMKHGRGNGRRKYKLATVLHPVIEDGFDG